MIAETPRLYLRELTTADAANFFELNEDPEVIRYTGDSSFDSLEQARTFLEDYDYYRKTGMGRWAVIRKEDDVFLGWCGLKPEDGICDIGFRFFRKYWGNGFATEAARKCLELGFGKFGMNEIIGRALKENVASIRVLEKIGLTFSHEFEAHGDTAVWYTIRK